MRDRQPAHDSVLSAPRNRLENKFQAPVHLKTRLLFFNRAQSRVVTGLHTGPNNLKRHLH